MMNENQRPSGRALHAIVAKVWATIERQARLPLSMRLEQITKSAAAAATAPSYWRRCNIVGASARTFTAPRVENRGRIELGSHFAVNCAFVPVELRTAEGGTISIGDGVGINFGTVVAANGLIEIGDNVAIGPYCLLGDPSGTSAASREPIEIGEGAWLAARVTVLPGARIGAHSVVSAGAVVTGDIPPFAVASGAPAKVVRISTPVPAGEGET